MNSLSTRLFSLYHQSYFVYFLVSAYLLLACLYSVTIPAYEAPDEIGHFGYVLHLHRTRQLPVHREGAFGAAQHPPLYYLIAAITSLPGDAWDSRGTYRPNSNFMWRVGGGSDVNSAVHHSDETFPYRGQALILHLARLASVLMGAGTVLMVFYTGTRIFPTQPEIGGLAATLVAFNPQFLFISGAINNDNLLILATTGLCFHLVCAVKQSETIKYPFLCSGEKRVSLSAFWMGSQHWIMVGIWLSVATLAKVNGLVVMAVVGLVLVQSAIRRRSVTWFVVNVLTIGSILLLCTGWWFVRNWILYGDLLGWSAYLEHFSVNLRQVPLTVNDLRHFIATQFNSFWGRFGWMNIWAPAWYYTSIKMLIGIAFGGLCVFAFRRRRLSDFQNYALVVLALLIITYEGYILWAITRFNESWYQGRYVFPVIGALMIFMSIGVLQWARGRLRTSMCYSILLLMFAFALYVPFFVIRPAYESIPQPKWHVWLLPHKTDYQFGESILLRGYELAQNDSAMVLNLYWQALETPDFNYSAFVHLIDESDGTLVQDDHAPGESAGYPPQVWQPEDIVVGRYVLDTTKVRDSGNYRLRVGLYNWETGERLRVHTGEGSARDYIILEY